MLRVIGYSNLARDETGAIQNTNNSDYQAALARAQRQDELAELKAEVSDLHKQFQFISSQLETIIHDLNTRSKTTA
nr:MAG TPA: protein of unknown function (DUF5320) [Caudoviricetes sp.]